MPSDRLTALFRAGLRVHLRILPRRFRRAYGDEMLELFERRWREVWRQEGLAAATRLFGRDLIDVFGTAVAERRHSSFELLPPSASPRHHASRTGDPLVSTLIQDLKFSLRAFRRQPVFIAVVVLTLGLGIGANTAVFSVVNGVLLQPLPYEDADELIDVWGRFDPISGFDYPIFPLSPPEWVDYRAQSTAMDDVAAYTTSSATLTGGDGDPERVTTVPASHNLFGVLRAEPAIGRTFDVSEDQSDARVVVLEHGFWQRRFGGNEALVGDTIDLNGEPWTVLGVMPEGFRFVRDAELWLPLGIDPGEPGNRQSHFIRALGRLAPGMTLEQASAEMQALMAAWEDEFPDIHTGHYLYLSSMYEDIVGDVRPALQLLLAAAGLVLLIVCANVASVLLARGEDRQREIAIRGALGAGNGQIVRLLLTESALLSGVGGAVGVAIAAVAVRALVGSAGDSIPRVDAITVDGTVLGFAAVATLLTTVIFGLFPALHSASSDVQRRLNDSTASASSGRARLYFRRGLVVAEVALSFVLVLCAGLVLKSFSALMAVDPGFRTDDLVVAGISLPRARYEDSAAVQGFYGELIERVESLPGVLVASASSSLPLRGAPGVWDFRVEGRPIPGAGEPAWNAAFSTVRPGFFKAVRARLLEGRLFADRDTAESQLVTVVNRSLVDKFFGDADVLGQRIMVCCPDEGQEAPWMTIVGVIDDIHYRGLNVVARPAYYAVHDQVEQVSYGGVFQSMTLVVRTESEPRMVAASLRSVVAELDADLPLIGLQTMQDVVAESVARPRFTSHLLTSFAALALLLGATGIYGVLAYSVAQRGREIGIRKALGAAGGELVTMVVGQGMALVVVGLVLGAVVSIWATRLLDTLLFGVSATDPLTYVVVSGTLAAVALVACAVPTLRAVGVDPLVVLRAD